MDPTTLVLLVGAFLIISSQSKGSGGIVPPGLFPGPDEPGRPSPGQLLPRFIPERDAPQARVDCPNWRTFDPAGQGVIEVWRPLIRETIDVFGEVSRGYVHDVGGNSSDTELILPGGAAVGTGEVTVGRVRGFICDGVAYVRTADSYNFKRIVPSDSRLIYFVSRRGRSAYSLRLRAWVTDPKAVSGVHPFIGDSGDSGFNGRCAASNIDLWRSKSIVVPPNAPVANTRNVQRAHPDAFLPEVLPAGTTCSFTEVSPEGNRLRRVRF